ncbi:MAG: DUF1631 family protein [Pseudomonadota bacterium]
MHIPQRLLRLAKERALSGFAALAEQTVVEADNRTSKALMSAPPAASAELNIIRAFLRADARVLRSRMVEHFGVFLERAMLTMHTDLRPGMHEIDYENLTLIDDEVVTRQIEVDRLVARLRDAEQIALGRVNLTIALIHSDSEVKERENPFRPYLLARSLYEAIRELLWEPQHSKVIFDALSLAMASRLPGYYAGIQEVFEEAGVTARLTARPTAMTRAERDRLAWQKAAQQLVSQGPQVNPVAPNSGGFSNPNAELQSAMLPRLMRLNELQGQGEGGVGARQADLQETIWNIFHKPKTGARRLRDAPAPETRSGLDEALLRMQKEVAAGGKLPEPLGLRERLGEIKLETAEKQTIDLAGLLFDSMAQDDVLPRKARDELLRIFLPFVRAAVMNPALLHEAEHPARRLIDRLGSVSIGVPASEACHAGIVDAVHEVVSAVLDLYDDDSGVFSDAEGTLDAHVTNLIAAHDARVGPSLEAIGEATSASSRLAGAGAALAAALQPLKVHRSASEFILGTWARVLSHPGQDAVDSQALLPELIWSAQEKVSSADRATLMRMLPDLVKRVRAGLDSIALPEAPSKIAFDKLVAVHMDVLGGKVASGGKLLTLDELREHFSQFEIDPNYTQPPGKEGWLGKFELEAALSRRGLSAAINAKAAARTPQSSDADWMLWARPGNGFEILVEGRYESALLCAVSAGESAFLFSTTDPEGEVIFLRSALIEAMESGTLRPLEYAPVFDRAVESLMAGAEQLTPGARHDSRQASLI